jgi:hypothetical protein
MINPKDFLNKENTEEDVEEYIEISGTFMCQECSETVKSARLNEEKRKLIWKCSSNHQSEGKL